MHFQYLIEDQSSTELIHALMQKVVAAYPDVTYNCKGFRGLGGFTKKNTVKESSKEDFQIGDKIIHTKWGEGMIVQVKKSDDGNELVVAFDKKGLKKLNQDYAPIKRI